MVYDDPTIRQLEGNSEEMTESDVTCQQTMGLTSDVPYHAGSSINSRLTIIPLPAIAQGIYACSSAGRQYGQQATFNALLRIGAEWNRRHPNDPRIGLRSVSLRPLTG
jgi:hypothetical protein